MNYDARFPVLASWSLEFAPVCVSLVFIQPRRDDFLCIGSFSSYFESLANCIAKAQSAYPWRVSKHILPPESDAGEWQKMFADQCVFNVSHAPDLPDGKRMLITQAFLSRLSIDTTPRPWDAENNQILLDSLGGYRMKELASAQDQFTNNVQASHEQYLARAIEHFAAHEWRDPARAPRAWEPIDYSRHDVAVICAGGIRP